MGGQQADGPACPAAHVEQRGGRNDRRTRELVNTGHGPSLNPRYSGRSAAGLIGPWKCPTNPCSWGDLARPGQTSQYGQYGWFWHPPICHPCIPLYAPMCTHMYPPMHPCTRAPGRYLADATAPRCRNVRHRRAGRGARVPPLQLSKVTTLAPNMATNPILPAFTIWHCGPARKPRVRSLDIGNLVHGKHAPLKTAVDREV